MTRPFLPFARPDIDETTIATVADVLRSGWITTGKYAASFEEMLSKSLGGRPVRAMNSATAALESALTLADVGPGDEVIVPALSFVASANVILRVGAKPVFVDVDLKTRNLELGRVAAAVTKQTKAIMPVHFAGLPIDLDQLYSLAEKYGLRVIEDAAHAIGSRWHGTAIGAIGDLVCFSFHPNKTITTIEGGALVMSTAKEAARLELLRFHGLTRDAEGESEVHLAGGKSNFTDVAAAVGLGQLARLGDFIRRRQHLARRYLETLAETRLGVLPEAGDDGHSWHLFTLLLPFDRLGLTRGAFIRSMRALGIGIGIHYDCIPAFEYYRSLGYRPEDYPVAARIGRETVSLPLFPAMQDADVDRVCEALRAVARR